ncbi:DUF2460 domain-containing protein [Pseudovibrio sp. Tun.PSC04-5.I4]|uniref:DUF2460 domain-containing protein n=1 Tax=Pseudovibrio sp. Tun.PSC04-5.I4 TaxID=1798213 RepID=UPI0008888745|nr:DUF2460 domain-containing protein [Pseudovibrio sp. Tun.PSC04-5.I4]SDR39857.1 TIGR02217 family protein [Pseudovibrio sp. Tun.PSC04-5.I4]
MVFHDVRLPEKISRGARGGPRRRTQVVQLYSGFEERNASWANSRREYDVAFGIRSSDQLQEVTAFFEARNGRLYAFRFKDWADYKSTLPSKAITPLDQQLGVGDGTKTDFQLRKLYGTEGLGYWRTITKPIAGSISIAVNETEQTSSWTADHSTGLISFDSAPADGATITAGFEFDVPCRFDTDSIDVTLDLERLGSITSIPLIEVRDT